MIGRMKQTLTELIKTFVGGNARFTVEHPTNLEFGDYSTNAGIVSKKSDELLEFLNKNKPEEVERVENKNGFINFYLSKKFFSDSLKEIIKAGDDFGRGESGKGSKVMVEYTDPNPFKEFHIGHLMSNTIGEAVSRIIQWNGAEVKRANYQGDVGMHVAKAVWGMLHEKKDPYVAGEKAYEDDENVKFEIQEINRKIYDKSDENINKLYEDGRKKSLEKFEEIYKRLGTKFDYYFFESETAELGKKIVLDNPGTFVESQGAVVFNAGDHDKSLHTRVFINSEGIPTYEAKELGLAKIKYDKYPYTFSVVITGNEVKDYFRVLLQAMKLVFPDLASKTHHLPHGMLRLPSGKMSSRTGEVITAESMIEEVKGKVKDDENVAIGALKYSILKQGVGGDIVFDINQSVSTEGDSGVYLQYAHARANSLIEKAEAQGVSINTDSQEDSLVREVERFLYRFPEIIPRAMDDFAPNYIATYLIELASSFNNFYAHEQVIGGENSGYKLAIVRAFKTVMKNGLTVLGIPAPERM
ncbi:arginine--tRNA ligase [Candidatus Parcubacteria bacterium]|nr:arginine--tRNA ligase [Candidatus Parcubacteria bacterium]